MNRKFAYTTIGFLVAVTPLLGIPQNVKDVFLVIVGLAIVLLAHRKRNGGESKAEPAQAFTE